MIKALRRHASVPNGGVSIWFFASTNLPVETLNAAAPRFQLFPLQFIYRRDDLPPHCRPSRSPSSSMTDARVEG
jgi:hypothetical protein